MNSPVQPVEFEGYLNLACLSPPYLHGTPLLYSGKRDPEILALVLVQALAERYVNPWSVTSGMHTVPTLRAEEIARRLLDALPAGFAGMDQDLRRNLRAALIHALQRMDLVTREEFDVQARLLARSRERLEELESRLQALEAQTEDSTPT